MKRSRLLVILLILTTVAWAKVEVAPLLALRRARQGFENTVWMEQRAKIGDQSVVGYIQGTGGSDDALMGFQLDDDWDVLEVTIGYLSTTPEGRRAEFFVEGDGKPLYSSGFLASNSGSSKVRIPLKGHRRILLRISGERYNWTAGAAWGEPTLYRGLPADEIEETWNVKLNGSTSPIKGSGPPNQVLVPIPVPSTDDGVTYSVRVRRDSATKTVIVERTDP